MMTHKKNEFRRQIKGVRWMIFWVVLAQFAAEVAVEAVFSFLKNPPHEYIRIAIVEVIAIGVPLIIYARSVWNSHGKNAKKEFGMNRCKPHLLLLAAALGVCGQFVMILLNLPMNLLFEQTATVEMPEPDDVGLLLLGILAVVLIPAILEEFWMRGVIFCAYNKSNTVAAVFFTSLMFALLHMNVNDVLGFMFMGVVASVIMIKCDSLYAAMVYHGFSNLTVFLLSDFILPNVTDKIWLLFGLAVLLFFLLFALLLVKKNKAKANKVFKPGRVVVNSLFSLPVVLSVVVAFIKYFVSKGI
ncbi:MAG: CPBP family intramembrane metalloprotease [Clostridia bacterium]|nr:CPBP family intramembrane metalloprotease [Clostridia bacterium]